MIFDAVSDVEVEQLSRPESTLIHSQHGILYLGQMLCVWNRFSEIARNSVLSLLSRVRCHVVLFVACVVVVCVVVGGL